jgi:hypothetical protein
VKISSNWMNKMNKIFLLIIFAFLRVCYSQEMTILPSDIGIKIVEEIAQYYPDKEFEELYVYNVPKDKACAFVAEGRYMEIPTVAITLFWPDIRENLPALKLLRLLYRDSIYQIPNDINFLQEEMRKEGITPLFNSEPVIEKNGKNNFFLL